jgi:hypothetical protein
MTIGSQHPQLCRVQKATDAFPKLLLTRCRLTRWPLRSAAAIGSCGAAAGIVLQAISLRKGTMAVLHVGGVDRK